MGTVEGEPLNTQYPVPQVDMLNIGDTFAKMLPYEPANKPEIITSLLRRLGLESQMSSDELELELIKRLLRFSNLIKQSVDSNEAQELSILIELLSNTKGAGGVLQGVESLLDEQFDANLFNTDDLIRLLPSSEEAVSSLLRNY